MFKNYAVTAWETNNYNQILPGKQLVKLRLKKETLAQVFSCEFSWEYLFLQNTSRGCFCELLIAKFKAYGLSLPALRFIHDYLPNCTAQKMKFSIKNFICKCACRNLRISTHLLKKSLIENFIFCTV